MPGTPEPDPTADRVTAARLDAILAVATGSPLSDEQREQVRKRIGVSLHQAAALRRVPLTNGDEPEIVFAPFRGDA